MGARFPTPSQAANPVVFPSESRARPVFPTAPSRTVDSLKPKVVDKHRTAPLLNQSSPEGGRISPTHTLEQARHK